jgi:hypothetical protein
MSERPILFSAPMVRALLDGRKTQTRRVVKPQPPTAKDFPHSVFGLSRSIADGVKMFSLDDAEHLPKHPTDWDLCGSVGVARDAGFPRRYRCPYGAPGDVLWVRETLKRAPDVWTYAADGAEVGWPARQGLAGKTPNTVVSIHMPRDACRLRLRITDVRVERLNDISEVDALAEGIPADLMEWDGRPTTPVEGYASLWNHINGPGSWDANPWVWAVSFERISG